MNPSARDSAPQRQSSQSGRILARLADLGLILPQPAIPVASYIPTRLVGGILYVSGQIPSVEGKLIAQGLVPRDVNLEKARECAVRCVLNALAAAHSALTDRGGLDAIRSVVRVGCFVACESDFTQHPEVANGASDLLVSIFGDSGRHVRAAVGSSSLPRGAPVEVEVAFEVA